MTQTGNFTLAIYKADGTPEYGAPGMKTMLDVNFDPYDDTPYTYTNSSGVSVTVEAGSLEALADKINTAQANGAPNPLPTPPWTPTPQYVKASIVDGRLQLESQTYTSGGISGRYSFGVANDSSGVLAATGINTFFKGDTPHEFSVRAEFKANLNLINAAAINGGAEGNTGDTITALQMAQLANKKVTIRNSNGTTTEQTILGYYATLVTKVGADTQTAKNNTALYGTMADDLKAQQDSIAGVNLDEEMTNLVKFQNSYKAAAKLITTADEMLQTLLSLKQ
jgi:flagellar hook-associated protein 1 FlgK